MSKRRRNQRRRPRAEGLDTVNLDLFGFVGEGAFTTQAVAAKLADKPDAKLIKVRINTQGGFVDDGFGIYNLLIQHPARVEIDIIGAAMSAGSYVILAADKVRIASNGVVMVHEAQGGRDGKANDLEKAAGELRRINDVVAGAIAKRTGESPEAVNQWLAVDTYWTAEQAVEVGIVDEIMPEPATAKALRSLNLTNDVRAKAPQQFLAAVAAANQTETNAMNLEEILAAIESWSDEDKAALFEALKAMTEGDEPATPDAPDASAQPAAASEAEAALNSIRELLGVTVEPGASARALISAVASTQRNRNAETNALQTQVNTLQARLNEADFESVLRDHDDRITPAMAAEFRKQFAAGTLNAKTLGAIAKTLTPIAGTGPRLRALGASVDADEIPKHEGKRFEELRPTARVALKKTNPALHSEMRLNWINRGKPSAPAVTK